MSTLLTYLRIAGDLLLLVPVLPVLGLMWLAWAITTETSSELKPSEPQPLPKTEPPKAPRAAEPVSLPQRAGDQLARPRISRRAGKYQRRFLLRLMGHGDYVTDWQIR